MSFLHGDIKIALKRIILPVNYWRVAIFKIVAEYILKSDIDINKKIKILDIGSPKLLVLFLGSKIKSKIFSTDLQDEAIFTEWEKHCRNISNSDNIIFEYADAKALKYPDNYFDIIYSLSVIHMIPPSKDGDIIALKEIQKKIKNDGKLIIEVPYRLKYSELFVKKNTFEEEFKGSSLFHDRQYDEISLERRITNNINGILEKKMILYEKIPFDYFWGKAPGFITTILAFLEPWIDLLNVAVANNKKQARKGKSVILIFKIKG